MWYISFHGSSDTSKKAINNLWVYDDHGNLQQQNILPTGGNNPQLFELRAFQFVGDRLYVVNGNKAVSQLLVYRRADSGSFEFVEVYASANTVNSILHPYDVTFDEAGNCYLSSQDTNLVTGLSAKDTPMAVASSLKSSTGSASSFYQGTIVASSKTHLDGAPTPYPPLVSQPQGLALSFVNKGGDKVANSVRGVVAYNGYLYVADEVANSVKVFRIKTGKYCGHITAKHLQSPVQLVFTRDSKTLYIGSSGSDRVYHYRIPNGKPPKNATANLFIHKKVKHVSGMAFDPEGNFYVAERKARKIRMFKQGHTDKGHVFIKDLPDNPEFIRYHR